MASAGTERANGLRTTACAVVLLLFAAAAAAQPVRDRLRVSASLSSDNILHGLSQTDDEAAARFAVDFGGARGWFVGGSLANVGYAAEAQFARPRESQLNVYGGYVWQQPRWRTNVSLSRYAYPDIARNYDYSRLAVTTSYRDRVFLTAARTNDYLSIYDDAWIVGAGIAAPWVADLELGVNAGRFRADGAGGISFSYWDIGLSRPVGRFALDLRFHDSSYPGDSLLGNRTENRWVFSLTRVLLPAPRPGS